MRAVSLRHDIVRIQRDGDGAVVFDGDEHVRSKFTGGGADSLRLDLRDKTSSDTPSRTISPCPISPTIFPSIVTLERLTRWTTAFIKEVPPCYKVTVIVDCNGEFGKCGLFLVKIARGRFGKKSSFFARQCSIIEMFANGSLG